jgi:integrase
MAGAAPAPARKPVVTLCLRQRVRLRVHHSRPRPNDQARHGRRRPEFKVHPPMLRHACGYALGNTGHDIRAIQGWLGHRSITSTADTALALAGLICPRTDPGNP